MIFIAEIGMNHNGNMGLIFELVKQASLSGANIAKFQLGWRCGKGEINQLEAKEINLIKKSCLFHNIEPMFSIITEDALELAKKFEFNYFKIASRTVIDKPNLAKDIIGLGKKTFVSLGMWEKSEKPFGFKDNIEYLWCKSNYPLLPWEIKDFPKTFNQSDFVGYSDHSVGIDIPLMAITRGAKVIEKHFTLDKSDTTIRDHALSATPSEFSDLVRIGKAIRKNLDLGI